MISEKQILELTNIVIRETGAEMVYLFGSYATREANRNSDIDLIIVVNKEFEKETRRDTISSLGVKSALPGLFFPKDFKLYSTNEFNKLKEDKHSFLYHILQNARPLYVRQQQHNKVD